MSTYFSQVVGPYTGIAYGTNYTNPAGTGCANIAAINAELGNANFTGNQTAEIPYGYSFSCVWNTGAAYLDHAGADVLLVSIHTYIEAWSVALRLSNGTTTAYQNYTLATYAANMSGGLVGCPGFFTGPFVYEITVAQLDFASYSIPAGVGVIGVVFQPYADGAGNPDPTGVLVLPGATALPVNVNAFDANCANNSTIECSWQVENEVNLDHYELWSSRDTENFEFIESIPSDHSSVYQYELPYITDEMYIQLRAVDIDGHEELYGPIALQCEVDGVYVYPNPTNDYCWIGVPKSAHESRISISDCTGRIIENRLHDFAKEGQIFFNTEALSSGIYLLTLTTGDGKVYLEKINVE